MRQLSRESLYASATIDKDANMVYIKLIYRDTKPVTVASKKPDTVLDPGSANLIIPGFKI